MIYIYMYIYSHSNTTAHLELALGAESRQLIQGSRAELGFECERDVHHFDHPGVPHMHAAQQLGAGVACKEKTHVH